MRLSASEIPTDCAADAVPHRSVAQPMAFLAEVFKEPNGWRISSIAPRLTVALVAGDDITWDGLMLIKRQIAYGDRWAYRSTRPTRRSS